MDAESQMGKTNHAVVWAIVVTLMFPALDTTVRARGGWGGSGSTTALTAKEAQDLIYLREEEKLARDVYLKMLEVWKATIFSNISSAEQIHTTRVKDLLSKYRIADPVVNDMPGVFTNPLFTSYYASLVQKGTLSYTDALEVGVLVEKMDIQDIDQMLLDTARTDVQQVLSNLRAASYNHLSAFNRQLAAQ